MLRPSGVIVAVVIECQFNPRKGHSQLDTVNQGRLVFGFSLNETFNCLMMLGPNVETFPFMIKTDNTLMGVLGLEL